jgi:alanine-synthesizing transaminase
MVSASNGVKTPMESMFSKRIHWSLEENDLSRALARKKASGAAILDLTESNPTRAGITYPRAAILESFDDDRLLEYTPDPRGVTSTREAVSHYYGERGAEVHPESIFLTASTSEAYGFLFKLLCDPGDEILVPRPSYPLFDFLASLDGVAPLPYRLQFDGTWHIDFDSLEAAITPKTRAVVAVHPNNPTGSYVTREDRERLFGLRVPLIVDEVFLDYPLSKVPAESFADAAQGMVFVLSGLSKLAGLPQMKLGWIAIAGGSQNRTDAAILLEHIADAYLSVGTPVQVAASALIARGAETRRAILERIGRNLESLRSAVTSSPSSTLLLPEGGWYAPLRLPAVRASEDWALALLEDESVYVHPGSFFGFDTEGYLVVSLLTPHDDFGEGIQRIVRMARL